MQIERIVESIHNKEFPNVPHPFKNPTQRKASSSDKSEKGSNPRVIFSTSSKSSEMISPKDCINVEKIENEDDAWIWICKKCWNYCQSH